MNWYYALGNEQKGPVSETELKSLLQQGIINASTLVWRVGLSSWQPYGSVGMDEPAPALAMVPILSPCADCGQNFNPDDLVPIAGRSICANCKPLALQRLREGVAKPVSNFDEIRNQHLNYEASIKSVGSLYILGGIAMIAGCLFMCLAPSADTLLQEIIFAALGALQLWTGLGLRKLKPGTRIPAGIFSVLGLLVIPIGTLINAYILYMLFSAKGRMVFSEEYKVIIAATPHIKCRTSILVWILLGIVVQLILLAFGASAMGSASR